MLKINDTLYFPQGRWFSDSATKAQRSQHRTSETRSHAHDEAIEKVTEPQSLDNALNAQANNSPYINVDDKDDYSDESVYTFCGSCKNHVMTVVRFKVGKTTILSAGFLCMFGCVAGCCIIPFMLSRFSDVVHSCPNCQIKLGKYRRKFKHIFPSE